MAKITSADCTQAIINKMKAYQALPDHYDMPTDITSYVYDSDAPDLWKYSLKPNLWKRYKKASFLPTAIPEMDKIILEEDAESETENSQNQVYPGALLIPFNPRPILNPLPYNIHGGKITMRWFELYKDDTNIHLHARVYEQDDKIIAVRIYGEG